MKKEKVKGFADALVARDITEGINHLWVDCNTKLYISRSIIYCSIYS